MELSAKESLDTFEIDYTEQLMISRLKKNLKYIVFTIQSEAPPSSDLSAASIDTFKFMMAVDNLSIAKTTCIIHMANTEKKEDQ